MLAKETAPKGYGAGFFPPVSPGRQQWEREFRGAGPRKRPSLRALFVQDFGHWQALTLSRPWRKRFDRLVEEVLRDLPESLRALLDQVPVYVEDYPSRKIMRQMGVTRRDELCGLFTGVPITEQSPSDPQLLPPYVTLYREGILAATREIHGRITPKTLREQIRITLLHELAHYHGLDERQLEDLGYQ